MQVLALATSLAFGSGHALLIGANEIKGGSTFPAAAADVDAMERVLVRTFDYPRKNIRTLTGSEATREAVKRELTELVGRLDKDDTVVIYFAGAGAQVQDQGRDEPADQWDEAWVLYDGIMVDDELHGFLAPIGTQAQHAALMIDASVEGVPGSRVGTDLVRRIDDVEASSDEISTEDGQPHWPNPEGFVTLEGAARGAATEGESLGRFTETFVTYAPQASTYRSLEQLLLTHIGAVSRQVPRIYGADLSGAVFGSEHRIEKVEFGKFELEPTKLAVSLQLDGRASWEQLADELRRGVKSDREYAQWIAFDDADAGMVVRPDPLNPGGLQIVGPEGTIRNRMTPEEGAVISQTLRYLWFHARQRALLALQAPLDDTIQVRLIEAEKQYTCAGDWLQASVGEEQQVPVCHRWQLEVTLAEGSDDREVGGFLLFNDGHTVGFPVDARPVTVKAGRSHVFPLPVIPGEPPGVPSSPPLNITEHALVFAGPKGSSVPFHNVSNVSGRVRGSRKIDGSWGLAHLPFRVVPNTEADPKESRQTRELTLNNFGIDHLLPEDTNSYLYRLLERTKELADYRDGDGVPYAQCVPDDRLSKATSSLRPESEWPGGTCWPRPWDFREDDKMLLDPAPGIDCSSTVWWLFTRTCLGNVRLEPPQPEGRESFNSGSYVRRVQKWHTETRKCLLLSDETFRGGYLSTSAMLIEDLMDDHWEDCTEGPFRTGDVLVTKRRNGGGGHTYVMIDPDKFVVFGSHVADYDFDRKLTEEEKALWADYGPAAGRVWDAGVEYQYLTLRGKEDLEQGQAGGFGPEVLRKCWRHKAIAKQWDENPSSQAGSGNVDGLCSAERCPLP
ncbi:MAG: caspase family protein [Myxococcota bacterium]